MALISLRNIKENNRDVVDNQTFNLSRLVGSVDTPYGFTITSEVFNYVLEQAGIKKKIENLVNVMNPQDEGRLQDVANEIQKLIIKSTLPDDVREAVYEAYCSLGIDEDTPLQELAESNGYPLVEMQSAPVNYNEEEISIYNINDYEKLIEGVLSCFGLHYASKRIKYRLENNISDMGVSITIKKSLDPAISGIAFKDNNNLVIKAVYGRYSDSVYEYADTYQVSAGNEIIATDNKDQPQAEKYNTELNNFTKDQVSSDMVHSPKIDNDNIKRLAQSIDGILGELETGFYVNFAIVRNKLYINSVSYSRVDEKSGEPLDLGFLETQPSGSNNVAMDFGFGQETSGAYPDNSQYTGAFNEPSTSHEIKNDNLHSSEDSGSTQEGSIFTAFKEKNSSDSSGVAASEKIKKDGEELVTAARHSLGQAIIQCDMAITKRLQQEYRKIFNDDSLADIEDLLAVLSKETNIPSIDDLREVREIRKRYIENMKTPSIPEVKYVFEKTRNFFNDF